MKITDKILAKSTKIRMKSGETLDLNVIKHNDGKFNLLIKKEDKELQETYEHLKKTKLRDVW